MLSQEIKYSVVVVVLVHKYKIIPGGIRVYTVLVQWGRDFLILAEKQPH